VHIPTSTLKPRQEFKEPRMASKKRKQRAEKKYKFSTDQPPHEANFEALPNGVRIHRAKTLSGTLIYLYAREEIQKTLRSLFGQFLLCARAGGPLDFEELARKAGADMPFEMIVDVDRGFMDELEACMEHALGLLDVIAPQLLVHASEQLVFEVFYRAACDRRDIGSYQFQASESELLKLYSEHAVKRLKQRVAPRKRPSRKLEWTAERCEEYLIQYERALDVVQRAKAIYQRNSDDEWQKMVKAVCPDLPASFYPRLQLRGDGEPHDLAREYAAEVYGVNNTSYLKKVIQKAREARLQKVA
jgi:tetratricopeptide (TPR) repeat protein